MRRGRTPGLSRREALAALGYAGGSLYLPSFAAPAAAAPFVPRRLLLVTTFHSNVYSNWRMRRPGLGEDAEWEIDLKAVPREELSPAYQALWEFRSKLLILDALSNAVNMSQAQPRGHFGGPATLYTSSGYRETGMNLPAGGELVVATGPSLDQIIAQKIALPGRLRSLELCATNPLGYYGTVWGPNGQGLPVIRDPAQAFARVFPTGGAGVAPATGAAPAPTREGKLALERASIVAFNRERYARLAARLGADDRRKIELHRDLLRDLELRLRPGSAPGDGAYRAAGCQATAPGGSGSVRAKMESFARLVASAFACDQTRVASIQINAMPAAEFGAPVGTNVHGSYGHHGTSSGAIEWMKRYYHTHAEHLAFLLRQLDAVPEPDGTTLLDNTIVLWASECGSWEHQTSHLPLVLMGGGGFRMGRYLRWPTDTPGPAGGFIGSGYRRLGPPHSRLLVSIARQFAAMAPELGILQQVGNVATARGMSCTGPLDRLV
jgi:hypothetical protein